MLVESGKSVGELFEKEERGTLERGEDCWRGTSGFVLCR